MSENPYLHTGTRCDGICCPACTWDDGNMEYAARLAAREEGEPKTYAVLLAYPDYVTGGDLETFYTTATAASIDDAVQLAREECYNSTVDENDDSNIMDLTDLRVLLIHLGEARDLKFQLTENA